MHTTYLHVKENRKDIPTINPRWLELSLSLTNFHGPEVVRATEVLLFIVFFFFFFLLCFHRMILNTQKSEFQLQYVHNICIFVRVVWLHNTVQPVFNKDLRVLGRCWLKTGTFQCISIFREMNTCLLNTG